jgi:NodT family efflux transporter outer membrane factor (OMF) lipoprotein
MFLGLGLMLPLSLSLGGCLLTDKPEPGLTIPQAYDLASKNPALAEAALPPLDWWRAFRSRELTELVEEAREANLDIAAAVARIVQADAQARIAGSALLPVVDLNGSATRSHVAETNSKSVSATMSASYEIDFWGKNRDALAAAQASARASRYDAGVVYLSVVSNTAITYFQAVGLQDQLAVARDNLKTGEDLLDVLRAQLARGTTSALNVSQQETVVAGLRAVIPPLEQQLRQFVNALAILIGKVPEQVEVAPSTLTALTVPAVAPGLPSELLIRRPDVQEAEAQLVAANANVKAARAAFFPSITLTAEGGFESTMLHTLFNPASALYSVGASITQPIFTGGRLEGTLEQQKARYDELVHDYRKAVISAFSDVENALIAMRKTEEQLRLEEIAVTTARGSYEISVAQLRAGVVDLLTVLNTQSALFQAETTLAQVRLTRTQAIVQLFQALGGGWQVAPS